MLNNQMVYSDIFHPAGWVVSVIFMMFISLSHIQTPRWDMLSWILRFRAGSRVRIELGTCVPGVSWTCSCCYMLVCLLQCFKQFVSRGIRKPATWTAFRFIMFFFTSKICCLHFLIVLFVLSYCILLSYCIFLSYSHRKYIYNIINYNDNNIRRKIITITIIIITAMTIIYIYTSSGGGSHQAFVTDFL
jgi:hypothetical protein